ncbi:hypothetical protein LTR78_003247 [Recurvomyces mirabilis]|uniref:RRM domain-containing protein n=1 Tax=Recurvomyces mirabilis TaxID=574656 RepID=A0AAE1C3R3_9PEZI|nr:hypothetical protein LTR78_003247 [Recurvomyces mirabilis]KAK5156936.1 hypothetical protein LTS14_004453 [Recurvomyces mirabilis]
MHRTLPRICTTITEGIYSNEVTAAIEIEHRHQAHEEAELEADEELQHRAKIVGTSIHEMAFESEWVHDRYEDDKYDRMHSRPVEDDRYAGGRGQEASNGAKVRVENIHYDITEEDLRSLFARKGALVSCTMNYDRSDRSTGTAWVVYSDPHDARDAVEDFDGQNAQGQKIRVTLVPSGPAERGGGVSGAPGGPRGPAARERSLFDRIQPRERSMFERIEGGGAREDERDGYRGGGDRRRRDRSDSPLKNGRSLAAPENIDRYVPGRGSRSPIRRRGTPRESGRRPGARREESGRGGGGRRGGRGDAEGAAGGVGGRRPKKTAEQLDAEMEDYFGKGEKAEESNGAAPNNAANGAASAAAATADDDTDMIL